jgi:hypothetical protein
MGVPLAGSLRAAISYRHGIGTLMS